MGPICSAQRRKGTLQLGAGRKVHWWCSCEQSSSRHRRFRTSRCHDMKWRSARQFQRKTSPQTIARSETATQLRHLTSSQTKWRKGSTSRLVQPILPLSLWRQTVPYSLGLWCKWESFWLQPLLFLLVTYWRSVGIGSFCQSHLLLLWLSGFLLWEIRHLCLSASHRIRPSFALLFPSWSWRMQHQGTALLPCCRFKF